MKKIFFAFRFSVLCVFLLFTSSFVFGQITSNQDGDWDQNTTWVGGNVPTSTDDVIIAHNVTLNVPVIVNNLTIDNGTLQLADQDITVTGTTIINTTATINDGITGGTNTFRGLLTVNNGGFFTSSGANISNYIFEGGITNLDTDDANNNFFINSQGSFNFNTNAQTITTFSKMLVNSINAGNLNINANVTLISDDIAIDIFSWGGDDVNIAPGITFTNQGNFDLLSERVLVGTGTWLNDVNSNLEYRSTTLPMIGGIFDVDQTGNTVNYSGAAQTISGGNYFNLSFSGSGSKTLLASINLTGNWTNTGTTILPGTTTVTFSGGNAQTISGDNAFTNLTINKSAASVTLQPSSPITVSTALNLTNGRIVLGDNNLTYGGNDLNLISFPATFIVTNGIGNFIRTVASLSGGGIKKFPIGIEYSAGTYSSNLVNITYSAGGDPTSNVSLRAGLPNTNSLQDIPASAATNKIDVVWRMTQNGTINSLEFNWLAANQGAGFTSSASIYQNMTDGRPTTITTQQATSSNITNFTGVHDFAVFEALPTYYSVASGNWSNNTTVWSTTSGGAACGCIPTAGSVVVIERGFTVTADANDQLVGKNITIGTTDGSGVLDLVGFTNTGAITSLTTSAPTTAEAGTIRLSAGNNLTVTTNTFSSNTFSTVEFNGGIFNIPNLFAGANYPNLTISGTATKTLSVGTTIVGGDLTVNTGATLQLADSYITVNGTTTINTGATLDKNLGTGGTAPPSTFNTIINKGSFTSTSTNNSQFVFEGNITNSDESSPALPANFSLIGGSTANNFNADLTIINTSANIMRFANGGSGGSSVSAAATVTISNTSTNLIRIEGSSLAINGDLINQGNLQTGNMTGAGTFTNGNSATTTYTSGAAPAVALTFTSGISSTFIYQLNSSGGIKAATYGNLQVSDTRTLVGAITVNGNLTISGVLDVDTSNDYAIDIKGNWINSGTFLQRNGIVRFNSTTAAQTITGVTTFSELEIDNTHSAPTLTLGNNITVNNQLTLTNGRIVLGASNFIHAGAVVSYNPLLTSWVETNSTGAFRNIIPIGTKTFPVGDATTAQIITLSNAVAGATVRFALPSTNPIPVPSSGAGSWYISNGNTASDITLVEPQGVMPLDINSKIHHYNAGWNLINSTFTSPNYSTDSPFAFTTGEQEFSVFSVTSSVPVITSFTPTTTIVGSTITITGTGFTGTNLVQIGDRNVITFTVVDDNTITAVIPKTASTGRVKVRTATAGAAERSVTSLTIISPNASTSYTLVSDNVVNMGALSNFGTSVSMADINGNGRLDLLQGAINDGNMIIRFEQTAPNSETFGPPQANFGGIVATPPDVRSSIITDIDSDGLVDVIYSTDGGNVLRYEQTAINSLTFATAALTFPNLGGGNEVKLSITDVDNNGLLDIVVSFFDAFVSSRVFRHYEQTAVDGGEFTLVTGSGLNTLAAPDDAIPFFLDINSDNLLDMLVGKNDGTISHYIQDTPNSTNFTLITTTFGGMSVANAGGRTAPYVTDLDSDGLLDFIINDFSKQASHYEQVMLNPFVTTWKTDNPGTSNFDQISIPLEPSTMYNFTVDWGDATSNTYIGLGSTLTPTHTYAAAGTYTVSITGAFPRIYFNNGGDKDKILSINAWGGIVWASMAGAFWGCSAMTYTATDVPNLTTNNVLSMQSMFEGCTSLVGGATMDNWNVSTIINMAGVFRGATLFNQDLNSWDVSSVTNMSFMFDTCPAFNGNISGWYVDNVTDMTQMFYGGTSFNQPLNAWDVSSVTTMQYMFFAASSFNQPLDTWNTSLVTDMFNMFAGATSFNQSLANWDVGNVTTMQYMLDNTNLSIANYDATLTGWATIVSPETTLQSGVLLGAVGLEYCAAAAEHALLFSTYSWIIDDAGQNCTTITLGTVSSIICPATPLEVPFTSSGTYGTGNVFTAQLSDATGSFITPLATQTGTSPIILNIPASAPASSNYLVRVVSSLPITSSNTAPTLIPPSTPPTLTPMQDFIREADSVGCYFTNTTNRPSTLRSVSVSSTCGIDSIIYTLSGATVARVTTLIGQRFNTGITRVVWKARAKNGTESATDEFIVRVEDKRRPILKIPADIQINADLYSCFVDTTGIDLGEFLVSDNCLFSFTKTVPERFRVGSNLIIYTARDSSGNVSIDTQRVQVAEQPFVVPSDSLILVDIFNQTGGANWTTSWNFNTPVYTWNGIEVSCGSVSRINLSANNLSDTLPSSVLGLRNVSEPNFSLNIANNRLDFESIEDYVSSIAGFNYSPQSQIYRSQRYVLLQGENITFTSKTGGNFNRYQWYKDNVLINGATNEQYTISGVLPSDQGVYTCRVSNTRATELTLERRPITLIVEGFVNSIDSLALVSIFEATGGTNWKNRWNLNDPVATWQGVTLSGNKAAELDLSSQNLTGELPDVFDALLFSDLRYLSFFDNNLTGQIPASLGAITTLTYLDLDQNNFEGSIPVSFGNLTNLQSLWLSRNNLTSLPDEIGNMTSLKTLYLNGNKFVQLPETLGNLSELLVLNISDNELTSSPNSITNLIKLVELYANRNYIRALPVGMQNLVDLRVFEINTNRLTSLPNGLLQLTNLSVFKVSENELEFDDLLPYSTKNYAVFEYAPQAPINEEDNILATINTSISFTVETQGNGNRYEWFKNGNSVATIQTLVINRVNSNDAGTYRAEVTNPNLPDLVLRRRSIELNIECQEGVEFKISQPNQTVFCEGQPFGLRLEVDRQFAEQFANAREIRWRRDGIILAFANQNSYTVTSKGIYTAEVLTSNGCTVLSNTVEITVISQPKVNIALIDKTLTSKVESQEPVTYQWLKDGLVIEAGFEGSYTPTETGEYSLLILTESGCSSVSETIIFTADEVTGIEEPIELRNLAIFPNPNNGNFFIDFGTNNPNGEPNFVLIDAIGRKIVLKKERISSIRYKIRTTNLSGGMYYLQIQTKDGLAFRKFVIEE